MQTDQIIDLAAALAKAQGEIEGAAKDSTNPHFKSSYADIAAVWAACRGPLSSNGLAIVQMPRQSDNGLLLVTRILHSSGQWMEDGGLPLLLGKQDMQNLGSAMTYARRFGLMAAVGIAPEDDDGNASVSKEPSQPVARPSVPKREVKPVPPYDRAHAWITARTKAVFDAKSATEISDIRQAMAEDPDARTKMAWIEANERKWMEEFNETADACLEKFADAEVDMAGA